MEETVVMQSAFSCFSVLLLLNAGICVLLWLPVFPLCWCCSKKNLLVYKPLSNRATCTISTSTVWTSVFLVWLLLWKCMISSQHTLGLDKYGGISLYCSKIKIMYNSFLSSDHQLISVQLALAQLALVIGSEGWCLSKFQVCGLPVVAGSLAGASVRELHITVGHSYCTPITVVRTFC